jgi:hypothetical protein
MMEDRIQVNGIWYVRETPEVSYVEEQYEVSDSLQCVYENSEWCFEASILLKRDATELTDTEGTPWITISDKRFNDRDVWTEDTVDSSDWMLGVYDGAPESLKEANRIFDRDGLRYFTSFIGKLIEKGWLKR